jgi:hypothetical protein
MALSVARLTGYLPPRLLAVRLNLKHRFIGPNVNLATPAALHNQPEPQARSPDIYYLACISEVMSLL